MLRLSWFYGVSIKSQHCIAAHKLPPQLSVSCSSDGFVLCDRCSCKDGLFGVFHTSASFRVNKTANLLNWISSAADYIVKWGLLWKKAIRDTLSLEKTKRAAPPKIPRYLSRVQVWRAPCALHTNLAICRPVLARFRIRCYLWACISLLPWTASLSMNGMAAVLLCPLLYL